MLIVELEELEPLVSRDFTKSQNHGKQRGLSERKVPRNFTKYHFRGEFSCTFRVPVHETDT